MPTGFTIGSPEQVPVPKPERQPTVEQPSTEVPRVTRREVVEPTGHVVPSQISSVVSPPPVLTDFQKQVEQVLEEGLGDLYRKLDPAAQVKFRHEGEVTAVRIAEILGQVKVKVIEIMRLLRRWLSLLPGVNSLFVESQAKLKAEKLLRLKR